jgi:hypothetical protein
MLSHRTASLFISSGIAARLPLYELENEPVSGELLILAETPLLRGLVNPLELEFAFMRQLFIAYLPLTLAKLTRLGGVTIENLVRG